MNDVPIANALKRARLAVGLSQQELADAAGVTRQTIGLIEANQYNPTIRLCLILATLTKTPVGDLFWIETK